MRAVCFGILLWGLFMREAGCEGCAALSRQQLVLVLRFSGVLTMRKCAAVFVSMPCYFQGSK